MADKCVNLLTLHGSQENWVKQFDRLKIDHLCFVVVSETRNGVTSKDVTA